MAGLSHFSHLISIDFLGDLFAALSELLRTSGCLPGESNAQDSCVTRTPRAPTDTHAPRPN
jgi:hypothetical protein